MADIWTMGEILVEIMRPRAGMKLNETGEFLGPFPSGAPAIFIDTVARLGHSAGIIGGVGDDDFGLNILERLEEDGVDVSCVERAARDTTAVAFVTYFEDGSRKFIYHIGRTAATANLFAPSDSFRDARFFHVMGCSLMVSPGFRASIFQAARAFAESGARISFDPNIRVELLRDQDLSEVVGPVMERCSVLLPGEQELQLLSGEKDTEEALQSLFERKILECVVLKRGKEGSTVITRDQRIEVKPFPVEEVDPTGAGDCFDAGFLCGLLENRPLEECGRMASVAGALNAAAFGPMEGDIGAATVGQALAHYE